jgi:hypothetical protein
LRQRWVGVFGHARGEDVRNGRLVVQVELPGGGEDDGSGGGGPKEAAGGGCEQGVRNWSEPGKLPMEELGGRCVRRSQGDNLEAKKAIKNCHTGVNSQSRCWSSRGQYLTETSNCDKLWSTKVRKSKSIKAREQMLVSPNSDKSFSRVGSRGNGEHSAS